MNIIKNSLPEGGFPIVEISNVRKSYVLGSLKIPVLSDVNLKIDRGEFLAIMGPSGSGKSTLVNLIGCLDRPAEGHVLVRNRDLNAMSDKELARFGGLEIGFVFQNFNLVPRLTALENVLFPIFANPKINIDPESCARKLLETMEFYNRMYHRPGELSGGQAKRVSIACALINDPTILPADEPIGNLDSITGAEIFQISLDLNLEGKTVVIVTHDPEIAKYARRVILVKDGVIQYN